MRFQREFDKDKQMGGSVSVSEQSTLYMKQHVSHDMIFPTMTRVDLDEPV